MPIQPFETLAPRSRLWIFGADRPLTSAEAERVEAHVEDHLESWNAHGHPVVGGYRITHHTFVMVAADEVASGVSGCSIDRLFAVLGDVEQETGRVLRDAGRIWYRDREDVVVCLPRPEFRALAESGAVGDDTIVFDPTITRIEEIDRFEVPLRDSWHARAFATAFAAGG